MRKRRFGGWRAGVGAGAGAAAAAFAAKEPSSFLAMRVAHATWRRRPRHRRPPFAPPSPEFAVPPPSSSSAPSPFLPPPSSAPRPPSPSSPLPLPPLGAGAGATALAAIKSMTSEEEIAAVENIWSRANAESDVKKLEEEIFAIKSFNSDDECAEVKALWLQPEATKSKEEKELEETMKVLKEAKEVVARKEAEGKEDENGIGPSFSEGEDSSDPCAPVLQSDTKEENVEAYILPDLGNNKGAADDKPDGCADEASNVSSKSSLQMALSLPKTES